MRFCNLMSGVFLLTLLMTMPVWSFPQDLIGEDGVITAEDILLFLESWHAEDGDPGYNADADVNGDGIIDASDFVSLAAVYMEDLSAIPTPTLGPEFTATETPITTQTETPFITPTFTPTPSITPFPLCETCYTYTIENVGTDPLSYQYVRCGESTYSYGVISQQGGTNIVCACVDSITITDGLANIGQGAPCV